MIKKIVLLVVAMGFLFGINSCKKVDEWTHFTMDFDEESTINASIALPIPIGDLPLVTPDITTNSSTTFESNNTHKDLIEEAKLTQLELSILSPTDGDFSFLESVEVYIKADGWS